MSTEDVLKFLQDEVSKTRWPFLKLIYVKSKLGNDITPQLNELFKAGKIRKRQGMNNELIELLQK